MAQIPANIAMQQASYQMKLQTSLLKNASENDKAVAGILEQAVENGKVTATRGNNINKLV